MRTPTIRIAKVPVKKKHVVNFGLLAGALMMSFDAGTAWAGAAEHVAHAAHMAGVTGAALSGLAAWVDFTFKAAVEV